MNSRKMSIREILAERYPIVQDLEEAVFHYHRWVAQTMQFSIQCPCGGSTEIIETPPITVIDMRIEVAENCLRCGRRLTANLFFSR